MSVCMRIYKEKECIEISPLWSKDTSPYPKRWQKKKRNKYLIWSIMEIYLAVKMQAPNWQQRQFLPNPLTLSSEKAYRRKFKTYHMRSILPPSPKYDVLSYCNFEGNFTHHPQSILLHDIFVSKIFCIQILRV